MKRRLRLWWVQRLLAQSGRLLSESEKLRRRADEIHAMVAAHLAKIDNA